MKEGVPYPAHTLITQPDVPARVIRQANGDLLIQWQAPGMPVAIYARTMPDVMAAPQLVRPVIDGQAALITGLDPTKRYYFQLDWGNGRSLTTAERTLPLQQAVNFRDIGGYETVDGRFVKWGHVYRAGNLHQLTPADQQYLHQLGLKLVLDLRAPRVMRQRPDRFLPDPQRQYQAHSMRNPSRTFTWRAIWATLFQPTKLNQLMLEGYIQLAIEGNTAVIRHILVQLAHSQNLPVLIHCAAGKDRTGIIIALLLALLGVPESTIIADYSLSNAYYNHFAQAISEDIRPLTRWGISIHDLYPLYLAHPQNLRDTFAHIQQKYGSVSNYLSRTVGLSQKILDQLRANLLE